MNIVLDTNLLIDGSVDDNNYGARIIDEVIAGRIAAFANRSTLAENRLIVRRKISDEDYLNKIYAFFDAVKVIDTTARLDVVEDYEDNKILESAVESGSNYLVTSDHHLLKLTEYDNVKVVTPAAFWLAYEEESGSGWKRWLGDFIN
jgi:putative PIN family toxin of toxin-antitoxin system